MLLGHLAHIFLSFLTDMYLYNHMISTHMTAYLYNRAILSGTPLFPPFVCSLLFSSYGSLWPPLFMTPCSVMFIVCDSIVLSICMLSQVAALLYISWTYILELGLKPDLVCNLLHSQSCCLNQHLPFIFLWDHLQILEDTPYSLLSSPRHWS